MRPPKNFHPEPFAYHQEIELRIDDLTNLGDGVGRIDGWVVMVPFALPGERVRAKVWRNKSNYSEADLVAVLEPSPARREPVCAFFGQCGGCQYQHLDYPAQLDWKTRQVRELLRRLGGIETEVLPCIGSPLQYGYRSKLTPHYQGARNGGLEALGFERSQSRALLDIPACPIASPAINAALPVARAALAQDAKRLKRGGTLLLRDVGGQVVTDMRAHAVETVCGKDFEFVAGEFFQNNPHILPRMIGHALDAAARPGIRFLVDAYCGVGVFGLCGSERFERFLGVEVSEIAVHLAAANAERNGVENGRFLHGSAEAIFAEVDFPAEATAVLLDPPRKGCDGVFLEQLFAYGPARVVYVSCGPDTQARDLKAFLAAGYTIESVQPFDLFPQTRHIENVVVLARGID